MIGFLPKAARILSVPSLAFVLVIPVVFVPLHASAGSISEIQDEAMEIREKVASIARQYLGEEDFRGKHYAEERLIDGEIFYRLKDYQRAAIIFLDIIETYPGHAAYPDALFYFADSLFHSRDFYGARQWFRRLLDEYARPGMSRFKLKAIGRLIEIAIHLGDYAGVEQYFQQLDQAFDAEGYYIKGKYLYFKGDYAKAREEFKKVKDNIELELKSNYFIAVTLTKEDRFEEAIEAFKKGLEIKSGTSEEMEIVDLMNLGLGRLYYEKDFVEHASEAYQTIGRYSSYYDAALYEAASVHISAGNSIKAERILEVLTFAVPDSKYIPQAKLLRGNLLLRSGRYEEAERVFEETIGAFEPVSEQLDTLMVDREDSGQFFANLTESSMSTFDVASVLPPLIVKWVGEEPEVQRAFALGSDLNLAKDYSREVERLVKLLAAVIEGPSRINAIPTLRRAKRKCQQMSNRLAQLKGKLLKISQSKFDSAASKMDKLASEGKDREKKLNNLPTSDQDFSRREEKSGTVYRHMRHELARNIIRLDKLIAMVVALERFIRDPKYTGDVKENQIEAIRYELVRHRQGVESMRLSINSIRDDVEAAQYQIGVGDYMDKRDKDLRDKVTDLSRKELTIIRSHARKPIGSQLLKAFETIKKSEAEVDKIDRAIVREAERLINEIRKQVEMERVKGTRYRTEIVVLKEEADEIIGGVTFENFSNVRKKFHKLVLKADVGIVDVAWMRKEEHKARSTTLTKDRLSDIQSLDDEFREVRNNEEATTP